jgi:hypothetical protein
MVSRVAAFVLLMPLVLSVAQGDERVSDRPVILGVVSGPNGEAIAGARVDVSSAAPKVGRGIFCPSAYLDCGKWTTTDQQGRFSIFDVDPSLKFRLVVTSPGLRTLPTVLIDPSAGPLSLTLDELPTNVDASRVLSGVVTQDGLPVAGAVVRPHGAKTADQRWWGRVEGVDRTVTDADGKFEMILPEDYLAVDIRVTGYGFCGEQLALLEPGGERIGIEVRTGANVIGRLVLDGKPIRGMSIAVVQLERGPYDGIFIAAVGDVTDDDGRFEFRCLPPDQRYCIYSLAGEAKRSESQYVLSTKTFTVPATGETRDLGSLEVESPRTIRGKVQRIDNLPLPKHLTLGFGRNPAWDLIGISVQHDGSFEATGLPPETYEIRIGGGEFNIVGDEIPYQSLSETSFGLRLRNSIDELVIPIRSKEQP